MMLALTLVLLVVGCQLLTASDAVQTFDRQDRDYRPLQMEAEFEKNFEKKPTLLVRCPGRVNLIGEHIDYNGYGVLPMALEQETRILAAASDKPVIRLRNVDPNYAPFELALPSDWRGASPPKWYDYFLSGWRGILDHIGGGGDQKIVGFDVLMSGNIPASSGLSSSSAVVCAAALCTWILHGGNGFDGLTKEQLADLCAKAERYVGTQGGGMDQAAEVLSNEGAALRIDFAPLRSRAVRLPQGATFVVVHSGETLNKAATSHYNQRVVECRVAAKLLLNGLEAKSLSLKHVQEALGKRLDEMVALCEKLPEELTREELVKLLGEQQLQQCLTPNTQDKTHFVIRRRARHVYSEAHRVDLMEVACQAGDVAKMGELMNDSHTSCAKDYECSSPGLDAVVEKCRQAGAKGARLTGAGWGGCAVALFTGEIPEAVPVLFASKPSAGISYERL